MVDISVYNLDFFKGIINTGINDELNNDVIKIINELATEVGSPLYVKTPVFNKNIGGGNNSNSNNNKFIENSPMPVAKSKRKGKNKAIEIVDEDDWNNLRTNERFKIESNENNNFVVVRGILNRITKTNFNEIAKELITILKPLSDEELLELGNEIIEISTGNFFYSNLYALLFIELKQSISIVQTILENGFQEYIKMFKDIKYIDAKEDYDLFCEYNRLKEVRKSKTSFFVNLFKNKCFPKEQLENHIHFLFDYINNHKESQFLAVEIEEIVENLFVIITELKNKIDISKGKMILDDCSNNNYMGITNKSKFKMLDIIESL